MSGTTARIETPLKRILEAEGRSQTWLARTIGVKRQQVWMWVNGIHVPVEPTREAIADALCRHADGSAATVEERGQMLEQLWGSDPEVLAA